MKPVIRSLILIGLVAIVTVLFLHVTGCAPKQFVLGDEITTPAGCVEARQRGKHEC